MSSTVGVIIFNFNFSSTGIMPYSLPVWRCLVDSALWHVSIFFFFLIIIIWSLFYSHNVSATPKLLSTSSAKTEPIPGLAGGSKKKGICVTRLAIRYSKEDPHTGYSSIGANFKILKERVNLQSEMKNTTTYPEII